MKSMEELKQIAMQEVNVEQKHNEQLYFQLKKQYECEVKEYIDDKVKQLIAGAENAIKEYYKGKKSAALYNGYNTGIIYVKEGVLFPKKHYYYRCQDGKTYFYQLQTADTWKNFYTVRYDDDNNQINEYYLLDSYNRKKIESPRKYSQYVKEEFKKIISEICSEPRITGHISEAGTGSCSALYWTVNLGYLDDIKK